ncbi:FecR family protein [Pedobacter gandavensis]|uniref:FecR family protein n=1 Tax=Pedobacter gandavensis TaxID=2679963 RepID=UPI002930A29C|nr:FecR family protein [Pedobacter gandavensis]
MEKDGISLLLKKYEEGHCSPEEEALIESWYNQRAKKNSMNPIHEDLSEAKELIWNGVQQNVRSPKKVARPFIRYAAAATIFIIAGTAAYFYVEQAESPISNQKNNLTDIAPGGNKAYLLLSDGKRIALTGAENGTLAVHDGVTISKTADGQLVYNISDKNQKDDGSYNSIQTPNGGQYQVRLPDGTIVWLNAASVLKYPVSFANNKERMVELQGEAYFEVAKDPKKPFLVSSKGQQVEVLGTHFNISSYANEAAIKTTLLEGAVKVSEGKQMKILKPGQQAMVVNHDMTIKAANLEEVMAWKNGYFNFQDEALENVMRQISRWYDVEVEYKGTLSQERFNGAISRFKNISQVLKMLSSTGVVHFKVEGRRVIVMP